ncbi:helix-turn-helix domain-containing protein [Candidatus Woesebacteria bacterium]|nr:helix-turn-helix domain-containing protein [Candidatus Woesebacteria bacterium]
MLTVGEILHTAREKKNLTLKQASEDTRIQTKYLKAAEENNWSLFSSRVYIAGILRTYAQYLDVDPMKALAYFRREYDKNEKHIDFKKRVPSLNLLPETKKILIGISVVVALFFAVYFGYQIKRYLSPPDVALVSPTKDHFLNVERITLVGKTEPEAIVTIFGNEVYVDEEGQFTFDIPLEKGKNPVDIKVVGANGRETIINKEFVRE